MSTSKKIWERLNEGVLGYIFYIILGIAAALIVTNILGIALETSIPLVAVVSGSMDHGINEEGFPCNKNIVNYNENFESWWALCDFTYDDFGITEEQFTQFPFKNGLKKGDIAILQNLDAPEVGDITVYQISSQNVPIIHRIVKINEDGTYQTKGDHNPGQNTYERSIQKSQIRGKVIFVLPYLGYLRVFIPIN